MLKALMLISLFLILFTLISFPAAAGSTLAQVGVTATIPPTAPANIGEGTTISGNFYTALLNVVGFTCVSILLLIAVIWFLNNRKQSL